MIHLHAREVLAPAAAVLVVASGRSSAHGFVIPSGSPPSVELRHFKQHHQRDHHHRHAAVAGAPGLMQGSSFVSRLDLTSPRLEVAGPASSEPSVKGAGPVVRMSCCGQLGHSGHAVGRLGGAIASAVFLRGGGVAEHNVLPGVLAELANIRTPAALLGGAALGTMFVGPKPDGNKRLHLVYTALSTSAFVLQLVCVLCSTLTYTAVASNSEALAVSAIGYLSEKMQYEFYVIRGSFVYGLFCFIGALIARGWLTFGSDGHQGAARTMTAILGSSAIFMLNFLHHTHNQLTLCLGGMTKRLLWLSCRNMYVSKKRLFRHILWVAMAWEAVKVLKLGPNQGSKPELEQSTAPVKSAEKMSS